MTRASLEGTRRAMVTGSAGFIGQHLVRLLLAEGWEVVGVDQRPSGVVHARFLERCADLLQPTEIRNVLRSAAPEVLLHLAARTDLNETRDLDGYSANTVGVDNLVRALRDTPSVRRWICTSSQLVCRMGYTPRHDADYAPSTLYGESKVRTERIVREADGGGREWCLVRPTTIWGPGMNPHYLRFFQLIRDGHYFHVGRGPTRKSYGYVGNTVHQYLRLLAAPAHAIQRQTFYLADYTAIALEEWADAFQRALSAPQIRRLPVSVAVVAAKFGDVVNLFGARRFPFNSFRLRNVRTSFEADLSRTEAVCGPLPYSVSDGVELTVAWLRSVWRDSAAA